MSALPQKRTSPGTIAMWIPFASRLSPIEEIFFATSPSAKTLRPDERQPFKERWLGGYIAYDIESFFVAITEVCTVAGYLAGCLDNPAHIRALPIMATMHHLRRCAI